MPISGCRLTVTPATIERQKNPIRLDPSEIPFRAMHNASLMLSSNLNVLRLDRLAFTYSTQCSPLLRTCQGIILIYQVSGLGSDSGRSSYVISLSNVHGLRRLHECMMARVIASRALRLVRCSTRILQAKVFHRILMPGVFGRRLFIRDDAGNAEGNSQLRVWH